jgi:hypothetical protein
MVLALLSLGAAACGDDGGGAVGELELVAELDPCGLLTEQTASALSGTAVSEVGGSLGGAVGCSYEFADPAAADLTGSSIAAQLVLAPADGEGDEALEKARDDAVSSAADDGGDEEPVVAETVLADAPVGASDPGEIPAVTVTTATTVRVVYVVEQVVVEVLITPADATVDESKVAEVVTFTETTVRPVKEATVPSDIVVDDIEGLWTGDWGTMVLEESDGVVRATYTHDEGTIVGTFENGVVRGWWSEVPSREEPNDAGDVEFRFTKASDGVALDGRWRYGTDGEFSEDWDLDRSDDPPPEELLERFDDEDAFVPHP